jgi:hypothetical protein
MELSLATELGQRMCAAWGLNPGEVLSIHIDWTPEHLPRAVVYLHLTEGAAYELLTLVPAERERFEGKPPAKVLQR